MANDLKWKVAGTGDESESLAQAKAWLEHLESLTKKAREELQSQQTPGHAMQQLVGTVVRIKSENWWEHWYH